MSEELLMIEQRGGHRNGAPWIGHYYRAGAKMLPAKAWRRLKRGCPRWSARVWAGDLFNDLAGGENRGRRDY
jgi:hypothetical protein